MADAKPSLARDGTMQVTAKEGIDYLKAEGKTKLLEFQGLADHETDKPSLPRDNTMAVTAKEGEQLLDSVGGAPDEDAQTRGQQRKLEEIKNETAVEAASPAKKAKLAKDTTMVATAKEAKELLGKEKLGDTRQETARKSSGKPSPKRGVTMAKTLEEAKYLLQGKEVDVSEGRRTRSQSKPAPPAKPAIKRAGTMQNTAKEGKDFLKRGKGKGKGKKSTPKEEVEEEEKVEEEEEEKKEKEAKEDEKEDATKEEEEEEEEEKKDAE